MGVNKPPLSSIKWSFVAAVPLVIRSTQTKALGSLFLVDMEGPFFSSHCYWCV